MEKTKSLHALALGKERVESTLNSVVSDQGGERERLGGSHEIALTRVGGDERRIGLLSDLAESIVEHRAEKSLDEMLTVGCRRRVEALRLLV